MPTPREVFEGKTGKAVDGVVRGLRHDFRFIGSHRVHSWYAWAVIGIVFGMTLGVVYVANQSGRLTPTRASEVPVYACESTTKTEYEAVREIYPEPFSATAKSALIDSNLLRAAIANIAASNNAAARNRPIPAQAPQTKTLLEIIGLAQQKALEACLKKIEDATASETLGQCDEGCSTLYVYEPNSRACTVTGSFENGKDAGIPIESLQNAGKPGYATPNVSSAAYTFFATATAPAMTLTTHCDAQTVLTGGDRGAGAGTGIGTGKPPDNSTGRGSYLGPPEPYPEPEADMPPQPELPASQEVESSPQAPTLKAE